MEKLRLAEKNRVISDIKMVESVIKRSSETLERFKVQDATVFNRNQIQKLKATIEEKEEQLVELQQRQIDITSGKFDDEIQTNNTTALNNIQRKEEITIRKKKDKDDDKKNDLEIEKTRGELWKQLQAMSPQLRDMANSILNDYNPYLRERLYRAVNKTVHEKLNLTPEARAIQKGLLDA